LPFLVKTKPFGLSQKQKHVIGRYRETHPYDWLWIKT